MDFTKLQGTGNDYIYMNAFEQEKDWAEVARKVSDRHFGIGADGLIIATNSSLADVRMRMFNADGSEGEMCGNGNRCFAKYVLESDLVQVHERPLEIETGAGVLKVIPLKDGSIINGARVDMGPPIFRSLDIPVNPEHLGPSNFALLDKKTFSLLSVDQNELTFDASLEIEGLELILTAVSMGNPHVVAFLEEDVYQFDLTRIGPLVEHHLAFPNRVNFHIVNVVSSGQIISRTWERGSGITLACGTGASAMVAAGQLHGYLSEQVEVGVPGGDLTISWSGEGSILMVGDAVEVFSGQIAL